MYQVLPSCIQDMHCYRSETLNKCFPAPANRQCCTETFVYSLRSYRNGLTVLLLMFVFCCCSLGCDSKPVLGIWEKNTNISVSSSFSACEQCHMHATDRHTHTHTHTIHLSPGPQCNNSTYPKSPTAQQ